MDAAAVQQTLQEDREEWAKLVAILDTHAEGPLHDPESPEWTARDVYTHLARWMEHSTDALEAWLAGRTIAPLEGADDDETNARIQREYSHLSLDEARERAQRTFERRIQAIEAVPADRWDDKITEATARADGAEHYRGHMSYINVSA